MSDQEFCTPRLRPAEAPAVAETPVAPEPLPPLLPPRSEAEIRQDAADEVPTP